MTYFDKLKFVVFFVLILILVNSCSKEKVEDCIKKGECIEVCGTLIATAKANSDICYFGCIWYEEELVNYQTLQLALEHCEKLNNTNASLE